MAALRDTLGPNILAARLTEAQAAAMRSNPNVPPPQHLGGTGMTGAAGPGGMVVAGAPPFWGPAIPSIPGGGVFGVPGMGLGVGGGGGGGSRVPTAGGSPGGPPGGGSPGISLGLGSRPRGGPGT